MNTKNKNRRKKLQKEYSKCSKTVKRSARKDKEKHTEQLAPIAQSAADKHDGKDLYKNI